VPPAWLKTGPSFAVSVSVLLLHFCLAARLCREPAPQLARLAANVTAVSFIVEMMAILTQAAAWAQTSHFQCDDPASIPSCGSRWEAFIVVCGGR